MFNIGNFSHFLANCEPTFRNVVCITTRLYDTLGIIPTLAVLFKMFFQYLCKTRVGWDDIVTGDLLKKWKQLLCALRGTRTVVILHCYRDSITNLLKLARLIAFCDVLAKAYAAVVYLRLETEIQTHMKLLAVKTLV